MNHIEKAIYDVDAGTIQPKKKSIVVPVILILSGVVLFALNFGVKSIVEDSNLNSIMVIVGPILFVLGVILTLTRLFGSARVPVYVPTGERLEESHYCFEDCYRAKVEQALRACDVAALEAIPQVDSAPMMVQVFATSSRKAVAMQLMRYVPHCYEPVSEVYFKA